MKQVVLLLAAALFCCGVRAEEIRKVLVIGNSIMKHGAAPQLGWNAEWDMAATAEEKDYAHLLLRKISEAAKQADAPELQLTRITDEKHMLGWDKLKNSDADIIVIQVSDNYRGKQTREAFQKNYEQMIRDLRGKGNPIIVCVSNWGGPTRVTQMIRDAAAANNALFADIATPGALPENRAGSEGHFSNGGVNWHPGDRGMAMIAETIYAAIESALKQKLAR